LNSGLFFIFGLLKRGKDMMRMNVETRKLNLINWISGLNDDKLVKRLEAIKDNVDEWTIEISDKEKKLLDLAEKDIEQGNLIPHGRVMEELAEYLAGKK